MPPNAPTTGNKRVGLDLGITLRDDGYRLPDHRSRRLFACLFCEDQKAPYDAANPAWLCPGHAGVFAVIHRPVAERLPSGTHGSSARLAERIQ